MIHVLYFDPGLGAMILQVVAAAIAGVVLFSKNVMYRIKSFLGIIKNDADIFDDIDIEDSDIESKSHNADNQ
ncbi:hypothetical protein [Psychroserpens algicola]|uniref:Uncharacterized protein n=1 Tax=Psychroserpens algicola TaxID=1719034 RepID=A0ABT0H6Y3_9FLAO|nr:hypothetical protein [Psychroserpens algicola]MCK8480136.1 hypothetical protein [Psychroserpens algicola]